MADGLGRSASRGAFHTFAGQLGRVALQLLSLVVLARLLSPADFGLYAMVLALIGIGEVLRDFGLSSAAIQSSRLSNEQRNSLFWINTLLGALLAALAYLLAPVVADVYNDGRIEPLVQVLALTFLVNGISTQHRADLSRSLRFGAIAVVDTVAQAFGLVVGITLALLGAEYWSLAWMSLSQALFSAAAVIVAARWMPRLYRRASIGAMVKYGASLSASQLLSYASTNASSVALGIVTGPGVVGLYNRAYQTLMLPLSQLQAPATRVALPVLSRLQSDPLRYGRFLLQGQTILLHGVACLLLAGAGAAAPLFDLLFGGQWGRSVEIFQILAIGGCASAANYVYYWVFLSKGLAASQLRYSLLTRPILLLGTVGGSLLGGGIGAAVAFAALNVVFYPFAGWWLRRAGLPLAQLTWNSARACFVYGVAGLVAWGVTQLSATLPSFVQVALAGTAFLTSLGAMFGVFPAYRRDVRSIVRTINLMRGSEES